MKYLIKISKSFDNPLQCLLVIFRVCRLLFEEDNYCPQIKGSSEIRDLLLKLALEPGFKSKLETFAATLTVNEQEKFYRETFSVGVTFARQARKLLIASPCWNSEALLSTLSSMNPSFAKSHLWERQENFYQSSELNAFVSVPSLVSSNAYIAWNYISIIDGILSKRAQQMQRSVGNLRLCVIELGAGHGSLSFQLARGLKSRQYSSLVVATDFHDSIFTSQLSLPWVRELCAAGHLDYAIAKASSSVNNDDFSQVHDDVFLLYGKKCLSSIGPFDAVVFVANYAFDSFPVDIVINNEERFFCIGLEPRAGSPTRKRYTYTCAELCNRCWQKFHLDLNDEICCSCSRTSSSSGESDGTKAASFATSNDGDEFWKPIFSSVVEKHQGAHVIPVCGKNLLQSLRKCFPDVPSSSFSVLLGDCFLDEQSSEWQPSIFSSLLMSSNYKKTTKYYLPNLQVPMISPIEEALAIPMTKEVLSAMLSNLFFDHKSTPVIESYSPQIHSSFSVFVFSQVNNNDETCSGSKRRKVSLNSSDESSLYLSHTTPAFLKYFGSNDLVIFVEMLQEVKIHSGGKHHMIFIVFPYFSFMTYMVAAISLQ